MEELGEVKEYIRCFKDDNEYNEKRNGDYYEPWLSLTKRVSNVKSFIGEYEKGPMTVDEQFNYFGSYGDDYVNTDIIESNITAIDGENQTVTVDSYVFKFRNSQDNKYFYTYRGEVQTTGTVERTWIEELQFGKQTLQISACTVNGTTFGMNNYDGEQYSWMEVDFETVSPGSKSFIVDHELQVNESVTMTEQLELYGYTSEEPAVGVLFKYINYTNSTMEFISDNGRHVQVGDTYDNITVKTIVETEEGETINRVNYNKTEYEKQLEVPLTFDIQSNGNIVVGSQNYNLEYKKNDSEWIVINPESEYVEIPVISGDTIQFRENNSNGISSSIFSSTTCQFAAEGNIMSLLSKQNFSTATRVPSSSFNGLFADCTGLTDASKLLLPATTLVAWCYCGMFQDCTSLTTAPELPATTLASSCYESMFQNCTSLTQAPALPATTLAPSCYGSMFNGCTSLTTAPELPATTLAQSCYDGMFWDCTSLTTAPALPATTLAQSCYYRMFAGCTSLTQAPELPATTLADYCYYGMFQGCNNLNYIKCLATDISATYSTTNWVNGVAALGTFVAADRVTLWKRNSNGIPINWNVQYVDERMSIVPLTFDVQNNGNILWKANNIAYTVTLEYRKNGGEWTTITSTTGGTSIPVVSGDTVQFRGNNTTMSSGSSRYNNFSGTTCQFAVKGNIMSLLNKSNYDEVTTLQSAYTFNYLFRGCTSLTDASELLLPATTLANNCYASMFQGCTGLTTVPELPATTLVNYCYGYMFNGCTSLTTAPELPATTLATYCYYGMFNGCASLTTVPELPVTTLANYCYGYMFQGCTSLTTAPELPATTLATYCYRGMFQGCTSLTKAPELPATTLTNSCYNQMFSGCTNLTTPPSSIGTSATTMAGSACTDMFYGCTSLTTAPELPATTLAESCYYRMFAGCTSLTQAPELPATTLASYCYYYMFSNCTSLVSAPELPATTLADYCYYNMFRECTSLTTTPSILPATTLTNSCYNQMFAFCTGLTTAPELPATTIAQSCYGEMFRGCTSLTTAPELPATTLASYCYYGMFMSCSNLNYIKCLATNISAYNCTMYWVSGVSSTGTFVAANSSVAWTTGVNGIPTGWVVIDKLALSTDVVVTTDAGGTMSVTVMSPNSWTASTTDNWISLSQNQGNSGVTTMTITISPTTTVRNGTVTFTDGETTVICTIVQDIPLTFEIESDGDIVWIANNTAYTVTLEYKKNGGEWTSITSTTGGTTIPVVSGDTVLFRGNNATMSSGYSRYNYFSGTTCQFSVKGNIMSLLDSTNFSTLVTLQKTYTFSYLFNGCTGLTDASNLKLPATTLAGYCYYSMFAGCTSLVTLPELPATTLTSECYNGMFAGCTSLVDISNFILPATALTNYCYCGMFDRCTSLVDISNFILSATVTSSYSYAGMFKNCTNLTTAPSSIGTSATTMQSQSCRQMFQGCTSLTTAPKLPSTRLNPTCYGWMFDGCTSLATAPELPATTLNASCYEQMFSNCTSLVNAPVLSSTTLAAACYRSMFYNCTSLTQAPELPATTLSSSCYASMFNGCTSLTQAPALSATTLAQSCYQGMFSNCTNLTTAPELPATTLAKQCYQYMFDGCTSLTQAPELPATTLAERCYRSMFVGCTGLTQAPSSIGTSATTMAVSACTEMFSGCTSLTIAPELPAISLAPYCYDGIFINCRGLTTAPLILPATTLAEGCYYRMFAVCTSLTTAPTLPATTLTDSCYERMFSQCTSLTTAPDLPATTLTQYCYAYMYSGCTNLNYVKSLATDKSATSCTTDWVRGVSSTGTFVKDSNMPVGTGGWSRGNSGIPYSWTVQDAS